MTQENYEPKLSWVSLSDDNKTIMLNGDEKYSGRLPLDIFRKNKSFDEQTRVVESVIYNTYAQHGVDSYSSENVRNCAREVVELFYERRRSSGSKKKKLGATLWGNKTTSTSPTMLVELGPEEQEEVSWKDIASVLSTSIKKDEAPKSIYMDAKTIEDRRHKHELISDPIRAFFNDAIEPDGEGTVTKERLYEAYRKFCRFQRLPIESYDQFCKLVKKKFLHELAEGRDSSKDRKTIWKGIKLIKWSNPDPLQEILTS
jgi:hypothetical protein